jgi:hypothetical protein
MAGQLGYKSAVVLSHMRTGRLPIPIDRAGEIAKMVGLEPARFLILVLEQRYPDVDFKRAFKKDDEPGAASSLPVGVGVFLKEVEVAAGRSILASFERSPLTQGRAAGGSASARRASSSSFARFDRTSRRTA